MGIEGRPVDPALCGTCDIRNLDEEWQLHALEVGRIIMGDDKMRSTYGRTLLKLTVSGVINNEESGALIGCLRNNINGRCDGLERPDGIYAVQ